MECLTYRFSVIPARALRVRFNTDDFKMAGMKIEQEFQHTLKFKNKCYFIKLATA